jgi:hypothetical protein
MYKRLSKFDNNGISIYQKIYILKIFFLVFLLLFGYLIFGYYINKIKTYEFLIMNNSFRINKHIDLNYENINFIVIRRTCRICGLFSHYKNVLGCARKYIIQGFIPIIEFESYKNVLNGFTTNPPKGNPWEYYFNQPFGYKYSNIKKKAKNIKYIECKPSILPYEKIYSNNELKNYWHILANKYMPIKNEIIRESNKIMNILFKKSRNVLGVLLRGTDYLTKKPHKHPIPPKTSDVIKDAKLLDKKNKYDWIFLSTEDNIIRNEFIRGLGIKVKCLLNKAKIIYNYSSKKFLAYNINFKKNIEFNKIYLLNIIILSKCLDFIGAKTYGTIGIFILTNGFRNYKVYDLGHYK